MITVDDAQDGYEYRPSAIGVDGAVLVYSDDKAIIQVTSHGDGFHVDIWYTGRRPAKYRTQLVESARRVGLRALQIAAEGWEIDGGNTARRKRPKYA